MRISDWSSDVCSSDLPCVRAQAAERGVEDLAADIVEINVDAAGAVLVQRLADVLILVVDGGVGAQLVAHVGTLFRATGNSDHLAAQAFGNLHRSDEGRVGKECVRMCSSRWSPVH